MHRRLDHAYVVTLEEMVLFRGGVGVRDTKRTKHETPDAHDIVRHGSFGVRDG